MNFQNIKGRVLKELNLTYKDALRFLFSKKFVDNRYLWTGIALFPGVFYSFSVESAEYEKRKRAFDQVYTCDQNRKVIDNVPKEKIDWKYTLSMDVETFQR